MHRLSLFHISCCALSGFIFLATELCTFADTPKSFLEMSEIKHSLKSSSVHKLEISISNPSLCGLADLEVIKRDLELGSHDNLIISVEDLINPGKSIASTSIKASDIGNSKNISLILPNLPGKVLAGIAICTDKSNSKTCLEKELGGVEKVSDQHNYLAADLSKIKDYGAKDKIYYFSPLLIEQDQLSVFDTHSAVFRNKTGVFSEILKSVNKQDDQKLDSKLKEFVIGAGIGNLIIEDKHLVIEIPKLGENCDLDAPAD